jgi:hypothetical protein
MKKLLFDILKVNDPEKTGEDRYSLSRVILLVSSFLYILCSAILFFSMFFPEITLNLNLVELTLEALRWPSLAFAADAFGGKFLKSNYKEIKHE